MRLSQARVNCGSDCDSLKAAKWLVMIADAHACTDEVPAVTHPARPQPREGERERGREGEGDREGGREGGTKFALIRAED